MFVDLDRRTVVFAGYRKYNTTLETFAETLAGQGSSAENITGVCIDLSRVFIKCAVAHPALASITFDKSHTVKIINEAVDLVPRAE